MATCFGNLFADRVAILGHFGDTILHFGAVMDNIWLTYRSADRSVPLEQEKSMERILKQPPSRYAEGGNPGTWASRSNFTLPTTEGKAPTSTEPREKLPTITSIESQWTLKRARQIHASQVAGIKFSRWQVRRKLSARHVMRLSL